MLALLHLAALGSLVPLNIHIWLKLALASAIMASLGMSIRHHALLLTTSAICELVLRDDGSIEVRRNDGRQFEASVSGQTAVLPWLIVMLLQLPGSRRLQPLLILPDSLPEEDDRILRSWLCWKLN